MLKAIIFDLDNCLAAADEPGTPLFAPLFDAIHRTNRGHFSPEELERIEFDCWRQPLDHIFEAHGFPEEMRKAAWEANRSIRVTTPMKGYGDLHLLAEFGVPLFLVTAGFQGLQQSKIDALGFANRFTEVHIDAVDQPGRRGKKGLFQGILSRHGLAPDEALVVGDNPDSEIAAGNALGIPTVQTLRPTVPRTDTARYHVAGLAELLALTGSGRVAM
ncbi:HAD family hydrolase [Luteolibacter ambystomatis]|uniref:HAD family hydrolase n=2 Tax=Luteolibacter ambystomatis TaxID=2824561 RepID=A0A975J2U4_9BACT|nr:HAD family hydrolase [Luteolibacter ambystomatis]QUE53023.1 HAD family hydrolase [Luteolibacter ambystomatis]